MQNRGDGWVSIVWGRTGDHSLHLLIVYEVTFSKFRGYVLGLEIRNAFGMLVIGEFMKPLEEGSEGDNIMVSCCFIDILTI